MTLLTPPTYLLTFLTAIHLVDLHRERSTCMLYRKHTLNRFLVQSVGDALYRPVCQPPATTSSKPELICCVSPCHATGIMVRLPRATARNSTSKHAASSLGGHLTKEPSGYVVAWAYGVSACPRCQVSSAIMSVHRYEDQKRTAENGSKATRGLGEVIKPL